MSHDVDPLYNSDTYTQALHAAHAYQERNWPLIKILQTETDRNLRQEAFLKLRCGNDDLFELVKTVIESRFEHAVITGHASVTALVVEHERDPINWEKWTEAEKWRTAVSRFATDYAAARCTAIGINEFLPWDYWLVTADERPFDARHIRPASNNQELQAIMAGFLMQTGCGSILNKIGWIYDAGGMQALISVDDDKNLNTAIKVAEFNIHAETGSLHQAIMTAHEVGHVVQARLNLNPTKTNLVPPHPFREIASMFFQKLFASPPHLGRLLKVDAETSAKIAAGLEFEDTETMMRQFCHFEWELILYRLAANDTLNPETAAKEWRELRHRYFGIAPSVDTDQSWLNYCFHLVYRPLYIRSYVLGDLVGDIMLANLFRDLALAWNSPGLRTRLMELMTVCSEKGVNTGWQDFALACGVKNLGDGELMGSALQRIMHPSAPAPALVSA